jgi:hypothetical protein
MSFTKDFSDSSRVRTLYARAAQQLSNVRRRYDPSDLFRSNIGHF